MTEKETLIATLTTVATEVGMDLDFSRVRRMSADQLSFMIDALDRRKRVPSLHNAHLDDECCASILRDRTMSPCIKASMRTELQARRYVVESQIKLVQSKGHWTASEMTPLRERSTWLRMAATHP